MDNQFKWKSFLYNINSKAIVPVIGNDLSVVRLAKDIISKSDNFNAILEAGTQDGECLCINLYKFLAFRLWDIFGSGVIPSPVSINNVVLNLQNSGIPENDINNAVKNEIAGLTNEQIILEPYMNLVKISGFETFITVNADNFLERAFETEGIHVNKSFNFSIPFPANDPNNQKDPAIATIYNLMGNIEGYNFALSDEQMLEYLYMLQNGSDTIAKNLFDSINRKNILLIGSSFPDWFMRFFIRIISKERFKNSGKAKYVACDSTFQDNALITFLENNATKIIPIGLKEHEINGNKVYKNSIEFIEDMYAQCYKNAELKRNEVRFKEVVFISYSRDDKSSAERLKNEFEKNGLNVFFDDDALKTGDRYNQVIKKYIKECDFFLAIISKNAILDTNRYVYDKEWRSAIVLDGFKDHSYIRPFIIDDTPPTDARIPEEIRNLNIEKIINFNDLGSIVRKFIKENNLTPIIQ